MELLLLVPEAIGIGKVLPSLERILSRQCQVTLHCPSHHHALLPDWCAERGYQLCPDDGGTAITHAVVFQDGSFAERVTALRAAGIPMRVLRCPVTRVSNLDRGDSYDVYIGRGSPWGNPYAVGLDGDRDEVIRKFAYDFHRGLLTDRASGRPLRELAREQLPGKTLGCHCKPAPCHGDIIAAFVNGADDALAS